ncbi:MAG TPA: HAD-IC family P-type ATPase [Candidatus Dormibacteraeota bacterium]|nr:HAD-IC family P-type ATPase [Candidatus Dormibacteraeota bacterium]
MDTAAEVPSRQDDPQSQSAANTTTAWHVSTARQVLDAQGTDPNTGLTDDEVARRRAQFGRNVLSEAKPEPKWRKFVRQYRDPMQIVLLAAGGVCLFLPGQLAAGILLLALTVFNAALGMNQEGKAEASVAALQKMLVLKVKVRRGGGMTMIDAADLVPGDLVAVEAGDVIPADGRLVMAASLEIDESALTGESTPSAKSTDPVANADAPLGDRTCMAYMNTAVTRGSGQVLVTTTGMGTEVGRISGMLQTEQVMATPLTKQLDRLTRQILVIAAAALIVSIGLGLIRGNEFSTLFLTAVAFAVSAIPTGLPAVVTAILARGTSTLADAGAIMKRLRSVETLGSTTAINSDKTGTLTLNQMTAVRMFIAGRQYHVEGSGYSTEGQITRVAGADGSSLDPFLLPMVLASDAEIHDGKLVGDPTEGALVVLAAKGGVDAEETRHAYPRVATLPFDAAYKLMASYHLMTDEHGHEVIRCYVKGAPDQLLERATSAFNPDADAIPVDTIRSRYVAANEELAKDGLRVMATAQRDFDPATFDPNGNLLDNLRGITLLALVGILDPPRAEAADSIARARAAGIQVRMITGDHAVTARSIAGRLGIVGRAITGAEFAAMSDDEAVREIDGIGVIARVAPEHKVRLVDILKKRGDVVAMTGDGVNDAPALKRADIGVAMGITGTEVSKEAAVMILTDDNFSTIVKAVELGRAIYDNLLRYVRYQMGTLFGFIFTFLGAGIFNIATGTPFLPLQTLWINFTVNVFQAVGLGFGEPAPGLMQRKPRSAKDPILPRNRMIRLVIVGLWAAIVTLSVIYFDSKSSSVEHARTMGMVTFSIFCLVLGLTAADERESVFSGQIIRNPTLIKSTMLSAITIILATELRFFQGLLDTTSLTLTQWAICLGAGASILVLSEIWKFIVRRRRVAPETPEAVTQPVPTRPTRPVATGG